MTKRLKIRKHADKDDCEERIAAAMAAGLRQGLESGRQEAITMYEEEIVQTKQLVDRLDVRVREANRERNEVRRQAMEATSARDRAFRQRDAAIDMLRRYHLAIGSVQTTLDRRAYVLQNGVLIHESTARAAKDQATFDDDINRALAQAAANVLGCREIVTSTGVDPHVHQNETRILYVDEAAGTSQTGIAIRGPDGNFSHFEYPEEDEALGRDRRRWGPGGQQTVTWADIEDNNDPDIERAVNDLEEADQEEGRTTDDPDEFDEEEDTIERQIDEFYEPESRER